MHAVQFQSLLGLVLLPVLAWAIQERPRRLAPVRAARIIIAGIVIQVAIAGLMLTVPATKALFSTISDGVAALQTATSEGMQLVFGFLAGAPAPYETVNPQNAFVAAFQAFPLILLISALTSLLFHWGVMQWLVHLFAAGLRKTMGVSGPLATAAAANIFVGMIEAPLFIRPYLKVMDRGSLFAVMTVGLATIAGTVLVLYATVLGPIVPDAAGHLIVASVISAPAALMLATLMVPPGEDEETPEPPKEDRETASAIDAITQGTANGLVLLGGVVSTLVVFVALVALVNIILGAVGGPVGLELSLERISGWIFAPLAWLIGVPWEEASRAGALLGVKTVANELVAFFQMAGSEPLSDRTNLILTYALSGFANFGSVGIMIGGIAAIVPERRSEIVELGVKSLVAGTMATLMTGAVIGAVTAP